MRVLHVVSGDLWAGAESQMFALASGQARMATYEVFAAVLNEGELAERLRSSGVVVRVLDERVFSARQLLMKLSRWTRELKPDLIHTHRFKENILGALAGRAAGRVPSVRTVHGAPEGGASGWRKWRTRWISLVDRWSGNHLQEAVIAVSGELAAHLEPIYRHVPVVTIRNGVDVQAVRANATGAGLRGGMPTARHVGIVGRLVPVKRVDVFLQMAALLHDSMWGPVQFHVIGDGPLRDALQGLAAKLGISGQVRFHGHRPDAVACIAELDVLVMTSDHEGLPMVALEALASGTPVVAHAVGGLRELLPPEAQVPSQDPALYRAAVLNLQPADPRAPRPSLLPAEFTAAENLRQVDALYRRIRSFGAPEASNS